MVAIIGFVFFILGALLQLLLLAIIVQAILSWLFAFDVINHRNRFVAQIADFLDRIVGPVLAPFRRIIPPLGGNTAFCNMNAVYEGLSDRWQRFLSGLEAVHDFKPFRSLFPTDRAGIEKLRMFEDRYPAVTHPVVTVHPVTGKKVLFVNPQFTLHIKGMAEDESRMILDFLFRKTLVHEYQLRHAWQPDMVVFWDNRLVQHSALHDYYPQRRLMERITIAGTRPLAADPPADPSDLRKYLMPPLSDFRHKGTAQKRQLDL